MVVEHLIQTREPMAMYAMGKVDIYGHSGKNGIESGPASHRHCEAAAGIEDGTKEVTEASYRHGSGGPMMEEQKLTGCKSKRKLQPRVLNPSNANDLREWITLWEE
jgi:hypothetical protein